MPAPLTQIESSPKLPSSADVVVVGGGIIGTFTAYYLAQRGLAPVVIGGELGDLGEAREGRVVPGDVASGQSERRFGGMAAADSASPADEGVHQRATAGAAQLEMIGRPLDSGSARVVLNLGGIANITIIGADHLCQSALW